MKLKDLKPGMIVAVGSPRDNYFTAEQYMVVDPRKVYKERRWLRGELPHTYSTSGDRVGVTKISDGRLVRLNPRNEFSPEAVRLQEILCTWDEYVARFEKDQKQKEEHAAAERRAEIRRKNRLHFINEALQPFGETVRLDTYGYVNISATTLEKLLGVEEVMS